MGFGIRPVEGFAATWGRVIVLPQSPHNPVATAAWTDSRLVAAGLVSDVPQFGIGGVSDPALGDGVDAARRRGVEDVRRQLIERAARIWEVPVEDVEYQADGTLAHRSGDALRMTFEQLARRLNGTGGVCNAFALNIADVEVDTETGKVEVLRFTAVQDCGKAIHPSYVEGQIQGGVVQGIGWALNEEYCFDDSGQMLNLSFLDYRMPTALDLPMIDTVTVEVPNPGHPLGVRGVGEVSLVPPMAAIGNAISNATGGAAGTAADESGAVLEALWGNGSG